MTYFTYKAGMLHAENIALDRLAREVGTPFYCYSSAALRDRYTELATALNGLDATICYALKANSNGAVVRTLARLGAGADVVSEGEIRIALEAGIPPGRLVFAGVGKTRKEMAFALEQGIDQFNVESEAELRALSAVAAGLGKTATIAIRVNPDIDSGTHKKISTGHGETKFGIPFSRLGPVYAEAARLPGIRPVGLHIHIGSQLTKLGPFEESFRTMAELVGELRGAGHQIEKVDIGGGLGITYDDEVPPTPKAYGDLARRILGNLGCKLVLEPGRYLVGNAGILVTSVIYPKQQESRTFVIVDAAMNDLIRPTLYEAWHRIVPVAEPRPGAVLRKVDIVGPVCETGDVLGTDRDLPEARPGDLLAILSAGAYGSVMASTYNARPLPAEVLVDGDRFAIVRRRPTYAEMHSLEAMPDWLGDSGTQMRQTRA